MASGAKVASARAQQMRITLWEPGGTARVAVAGVTVQRVTTSSRLVARGRGFRWDYEVGDTRHRVMLEYGLRVCARPEGQPRRRCRCSLEPAAAVRLTEERKSR